MTTLDRFSHWIHSMGANTPTREWRRRWTSLYCLRTADTPRRCSCRSSSLCGDLQGKRRADERTRTADLISLRVICRALQRFAHTCESRISKGVSLLRLALCCTVLRSHWYQSGIRSPRITRRRFLSKAGAAGAGVFAEPTRRTPRGNFHLRVGPSVAFIRVDIHSGLIHVVLTFMLRSRTKEILRRYYQAIHAECWIRTSENIPSTQSGE
jgi:hypothetical protein